jgi:RNA polymerase sigma factor (sigma-70 family)
MQRDEPFHSGDDVTETELKEKGSEEDHVTKLALLAKQAMDDYKHLCKERQIEPEVNKTHDEYIRFCEDKRVQSEVNSICRHAAKDFNHVEAIRHGDLPSLAWERMPHTVECFKGEALFRTYLNRVVRNKCIDEARKVKNDPEFVSLEKHSPPQPDAFSRMTPLELKDCLNRAAERALSEQEREVLRLLLKGERTSEIARQYGVSPQTARTWAHRIPQKLRQGIEELDQAQQKAKRAAATTTNDRSAT